MTGELRIWVAALSKHPPEAIEWAFVEYLKIAQFFPKPGDILGFINAWHRAQRERAELETRKREREKDERRRRNGQCVDFGEIIAKFKQIASEKSLPAESGRRDELKKQIARMRAKSDKSVTSGEKAVSGE